MAACPKMGRMIWLISWLEAQPAEALLPSLAGVASKVPEGRDTHLHSGQVRHNTATHGQHSGCAPHSAGFCATALVRQRRPGAPPELGSARAAGPLARSRVHERQGLGSAIARVAKEVVAGGDAARASPAAPLGHQSAHTRTHAGGGRVEGRQACACAMHLGCHQQAAP